ncbi:MAG: kinase/pyrophosphorylase [Candidatus Cloacimonetes bacterium]|nr:kinase/pyrophosphorylase [Candidatus Cloacimonadota bacterium]MBS3768004.1 kinase/pyrophosphorylase [Candidatus Cloacimonadota bacterium]
MYEVQKKGSNGRRRHIFVVSDATASTCEIVVKAALSQFKETSINLHKVRYVTTENDVDRVIDEAREVNGIVAYTFVSKELRQKIEKEGKNSAVPTIDVLGPILTRLTDYLEISPMAVPGLFRNLNQEYYKRIDCIDYAVKHDDGKHIENLSDAEIVIVGPSRTSKTPISIYLAYRNFRVSNIPYIYGVELPSQLMEIDNKKVIGLYVTPLRLKKIREVRSQKYAQIKLKDYIDLHYIQKEMKAAINLYNRNNWNVVEVTSKSIEEAATEIMRTIGDNH